MAWDKEKHRYTEGTFLGLWRDYLKYRNTTAFSQKVWGTRAQKTTWPWHSLRMIANRFPQGILGPFEKYYWASHDVFGADTWWAPHNLWRALWHAAGGMTIVGLYFGMCNEVKDGWKGAKTRFDILSWLAGGIGTGVLLVVYL